MPIGIACPSCAAKYRVPDQYAGKSATCKKCGTKIPVPAGDEIQFRDDGATDSSESLRSASMTAAPPTPSPMSSPPRAELAAPSSSPRRMASRPAPVVTDDEDDEAEDGPVRDRNGLRPVHPGADPWSGLLVLLYLATLAGIGLFNQHSTSRQASDLRATMPIGGLWVQTILQGVLFFILVAPLAMIGVFAASHILRFALAPSAYLKAGGAAAAPLVGIGLASLLIGQFLISPKASDEPSSLVGVVNLLGIGGGLALAVFMLRNAFGLNWAETGAAFAMAALLGGIGVGLQDSLGDSLTRTITVAMKLGAPTVSTTPKKQDLNPLRPFQPSDSAPTNSSASDDAITAKLGTLTAEANTLTSTQSLQSNSREAIAGSLATLRTQAGALADDVKQRPELAAKFASLMATLDNAPALLTNVPSAKPDSALNEPIASAGLTPLAVPDAAADTLGEPVTLNAFSVQPPKSATIDLSATAASIGTGTPGSAFMPSTLSWTTPEGGRLTFATAPAKSFAQRRPWVRTRAYMQTMPGVFTVDDSSVGPVAVDTASVNQMPVTRVSLAGSTPFEQFITLQNGTWVTVTAQANDAGGMAAVSAAARSLKPAPGATDNPLTPAVLAEHLGGDDGDAAAALLRRTGPSAEPAVIDKLHDHNVRVRRSAIAVLGDIGSSRSIAALAEVVRSNDTFCADAAKASLRKLAPKSMDATNEALLDLEGSSPDQHRSAMMRLAQLKPDDARRPRVAAALEKMIAVGSLGGHSDIDAAGDALAVWATPETVRNLLPILKDPTADLSRRHAVLSAYGKMHDSRAAYIVAQYMSASPADISAAKESLIAMGPTAELSTIRDLNAPATQVRVAACEVLEQIGGQKSENALGTVIRDQKDAEAAAAARSALLTIKDRVAAASGGPTGLFDLGDDPKPASQSQTAPGSSIPSR